MARAAFRALDWYDNQLLAWGYEDSIERSINRWHIAANHKGKHQ